MSSEKITQNTESADIKPRIRKVLMAMAPDRFHAAAPELEPDARACSQLLNEISDRMKRGFDFKQWSPEVRERLPLGSTVTLVAMQDGAMREPLTVRLNRPEIFVRMCEEYIATGAVSPELVDDTEEDEAVDAPGEFDDEPEFPDTTDTDLLKFQDLILKAKTVKRLAYIRELAKTYSVQKFEEGGIFAALDAHAASMIEAEISAGTPESMQAAVTYVKEFPFSDDAVRERLESLLTERVQQDERLAYPLPSDMSALDKRIMAARTIDDLAAIARETAPHPNDTSPEARKTAYSIDSSAKLRLLEACKKQADGGTFSDYERAMRDASSFPFSRKEYGEDVRAVIETRAKYFLLGALAQAATPEDTETLQAEAERFPFSDDNRKDLNDEFIATRERMRGNPISAQHVTPLDRHKQEEREWINPMRHWLNRLFGLRDR